MWMTMSSVFDTVFGLRFFEGDTDTVLFVEKNQAFNQTFKIYFSIFGTINKSIMRMLWSQPAKSFSYFLGPRWLELTPKENFRNRCDPGMYPGCDPCEFFFCRRNTSHENQVINFQTQEEVLCDWVSSKISGIHICCILLMSFFILSSFRNL